jgi:hypothetical protein
MRRVAGLAIQQRPLQDAEIVCGEVSRVMLREMITLPPNIIISKSDPNVCFWHIADIATVLIDVRFWG